MEVVPQLLAKHKEDIYANKIIRQNLLIHLFFNLFLFSLRAFFALSSTQLSSNCCIQTTSYTR